MLVLNKKVPKICVCKKKIPLGEKTEGNYTLNWQTQTTACSRKVAWRKAKYKAKAMMHLYAVQLKQWEIQWIQHCHRSLENWGMFRWEWCWKFMSPDGKFHLIYIQAHCTRFKKGCMMWRSYPFLSSQKLLNTFWWNPLLDIWSKMCQCMCFSFISQT